MSEAVAIRRFFHATLDSLAVGGAYQGVAPAGTPFPYIVYWLLSGGNDRQTMTLNRIWSDPLYGVKVVDKAGGTGAIESIADAVDVALQGAEGFATGGVIVTCYRERILDQPERTDGVDYQNLGGEYRVIVKGA